MTKKTNKKKNCALLSVHLRNQTFFLIFFCPWLLFHCSSLTLNHSPNVLFLLLSCQLITLTYKSGTVKLLNTRSEPEIVSIHRQLSRTSKNQSAFYSSSLSQTQFVLIFLVESWKNYQREEFYTENVVLANMILKQRLAENWAFDW